MITRHLRFGDGLAARLLLGAWMSAVLAAAGAAPVWWAPGQGTPLPDFAAYDNDRGQLGVLNASGRLDTKGHPFFEALGTNGRACVTCHQPSDGMALAVRSIRERWSVTRGKDPLFAAIDGMNCPNLPPDDPRSHSLLLERGLIRVSLPWPPERPDGTRIDPEFTLEVAISDRSSSRGRLRRRRGGWGSTSRRRARGTPLLEARTIKPSPLSASCLSSRNGVPSRRTARLLEPKAANMSCPHRYDGRVRQCQAVARRRRP